MNHNDGFIDEIVKTDEGYFCTGWAYSSLKSKILVSLFYDGDLVSCGYANLFREDLLEVTETGCHAFMIKVNEYYDISLMSASFYVGEEEIVLNGSFEIINLIPELKKIEYVHNDRLLCFEVFDLNRLVKNNDIFESDIEIKLDGKKFQYWRLVFSCFEFFSIEIFGKNSIEITPTIDMLGKRIEIYYCGQVLKELEIDLSLFGEFYIDFELFNEKLYVFGNNLLESNFKELHALTFVLEDNKKEKEELSFEVYSKFSFFIESKLKKISSVKVKYGSICILESKIKDINKISLKDLTVIGFVESINNECITGWARYESIKAKRVLLDVYVFGEILKTVIAKEYREDLALHFKDSGEWAFKIDLNLDYIKFEDLNVYILPRYGSNQIVNSSVKVNKNSNIIRGIDVNFE